MLAKARRVLPREGAVVANACRDGVPGTYRLAPSVRQRRIRYRRRAGGIPIDSNQLPRNAGPGGAFGRLALKGDELHDRRRRSEVLTAHLTNHHAEFPRQFRVSPTSIALAGPCLPKLW